jgi:superfamily II DNA or RNA helicase
MASSAQPASATLTKDDKVRLDGEIVTVVAVESETTNGIECIVKSPSRGYVGAFFPWGEIAAAKVPAHDGGGDSQRILTALWTKWMQHATPRIRSAVLATKPLRPFAHQDEAVFRHMLVQPRLRFLLADEPGTGKTIMTGMYLTEGRRRGLIPGKVLIVVPAHLVEKWLRDLKRYFGVDAMRLTPEIGREPQPLRPDIDVWIVSVDLFTHNSDVRRKAVGTHASWSLSVVDEAHRLTPTSQYLGAAQQLAKNTHHLLLLTATPHRGKENFFRALLNLLDPALYPWAESQQSASGTPLRPSSLSFLRRMKEDLRDLEGNPLFPARFAETMEVTLSPVEADAYAAVMEYVDTWYDSSSILARSIYGKRAASSINAALETLLRRSEALSRTQSGRVEQVTPHGFDDPYFRGADLDSDEAWGEAERNVVEAKSRDRRVELETVKDVISRLRATLHSSEEPAKWQVAKRLLARHGIRPGPTGGQLLVFTEFTDTARWLIDVFRNEGYTTELLAGGADHHERDRLQQRFLNDEFQVLISTDAGGEGIDLQSAFVMIDWDVPWSLVRLEQRMGRLHRIGQRNDVYIYHLVAPTTREGRVQQVMLQNLSLAGDALQGRIFDLLDATASAAGFDYGRALAEAQRGGGAADAAIEQIPDAGRLIAKAKELAAEEDRFRTPTNVQEAHERFARDRLEAINPVIVEGFLRQVATTEGWSLLVGPVPGIEILRSSAHLPPFLGAGSECLVAADGSAVQKARAEGFSKASDVVVLGPTEEPFQELVAQAARRCDGDLFRGGAVVDRASLTSYFLFAYHADIEHHDGIRKVRHTVPFLIRFSGAGAFPVAWESIMNLDACPTESGSPPPAARYEAEAAANEAVEAELARLRQEKGDWVKQARDDLDAIERRYRAQIRNLPAEQRKALVESFALQKEQRVVQLDAIRSVAAMKPRLLGWIYVEGGARTAELGRDPDSEKVAISTVVSELERLGFSVDDRQTAGLGYDLFARRAGDQRLVEVKGFKDDLKPVTLEQYEWAQAQQRGSDYWLYVVVNCATEPAVLLRVKDPAATFPEGPKMIQRFSIPVSALRKLVKA